VRSLAKIVRVAIRVTAINPARAARVSASGEVIGWARNA